MGCPFGTWRFRLVGHRHALQSTTDDWIPAFKVVLPEIYKNYVKLQANTDVRDSGGCHKVIRAAAIHRVTDIYGPVTTHRWGATSVPYGSYDYCGKKSRHAVRTARQGYRHPYGAPLQQFLIPKADKVYDGNIENGFASPIHPTPHGSTCG